MENVFANVSNLTDLRNVVFSFWNDNNPHRGTKEESAKNLKLVGEMYAQAEEALESGNIRGDQYDPLKQFSLPQIFDICDYLYRLPGIKLVTKPIGLMQVDGIREDKVGMGRFPWIIGVDNSGQTEAVAEDIKGVLAKIQAEVDPNSPDEVLKNTFTKVRYLGISHPDTNNEPIVGVWEIVTLHPNQPREKVAVRTYDQVVAGIGQAGSSPASTYKPLLFAK